MKLIFYPIGTKIHSMINGSGIIESHLFDGVHRGSGGYDRHENNGHSVVVILIGTPQNHTEELEDVERVEDLQEETKGKISESSAVVSMTITIAVTNRYVHLRT